MKTTCEHCIFLSEDKCDLGYLDIFDNSGLVVTNNETKKPEVNNVACPGCRNIYWLENHEKEDIYDELKLQYSAIILVDGGEDFIPQIELLNSLTAKPKSVIISLINSDIEKAQLLQAKLGVDFPEIIIIIDNFLSAEEDKVRVKSGVNRAKSPNFLCVKNGCSDLSVIDRENERKIKQMSSTTLMVGKEFFYCNTVVYKRFYDYENPIEAIVKFIEESQNAS